MQDLFFAFCSVMMVYGTHFFKLNRHLLNFAKVCSGLYFFII